MRKQLFWISCACCMVAVLIVPTQRSDGAEQASKLKNIQVLTDLTDREIGQLMQQWARQLGVKCTECHVQGDFASDENKHKPIARKMAAMVKLLNEQPFFAEGDRKADCFLCHKGSAHIEPTP